MTTITGNVNLIWTAGIGCHCAAGQGQAQGHWQGHGNNKKITSSQIMYMHSLSQQWQALGFNLIGIWFLCYHPVKYHSECFDCIHLFNTASFIELNKPLNRNLNLWPLQLIYIFLLIFYTTHYISFVVGKLN